MKTSTLRNGLTLIGVLLFNLLFWDEKLALNLGIFHLFLLGGLAIIYRKQTFTPAVKILGAATIYATTQVILQGSSIAIFTYWLTLFAFIGTFHSDQLRSLHYAFFEACYNLVRWPTHLRLGSFNSKSTTFNKYFSYLKYGFIPLVVGLLFYFIFREANPVFREAVDGFWDGFGELIADLFVEVSFARILFSILGLFLCGWIFIIKSPSALQKWEALKEIMIVRKKDTKDGRPSIWSVGLRTEHRTAIMLVALVNVMLVAVNLIDIHWIWINFDPNSVGHLSQFVHEGTYLLILSILLSIAIMIYFFRGNQNFYPGKNLLQKLSLFWVIQNTVLVISVGLRNYHYIDNMGLAYKRIGVIFFLLATFGGLVTMYFKIKESRSSFYLLKTNLWIVMGCFCVLSSVNWDRLIVKHNLQHWNKQQVDVPFLFELSDSALPELYRNVDQLDNLGWSAGRAHSTDYKEMLEDRIDRFLSRHDMTSALSWNYDDYRTANELKIIYHDNY